LVPTLVVATVLSILVVILGGSGLYLYQIDRSVTANINRGIELPADGPDGAKRPVKDAQADRTLDYVLIGSDDGDPELDRGGRSDSIMIVHLNEDRDQAYVISIPRDTWVTIPGHGKNTVNAAYALGGAPLVVRTMETLTGARMDHVAMIDFRGFVNFTQDLGGVTVHNRTAFSSHGYSYPAGDITLAGDQALWYVRERAAFSSELERNENQRKVLKATLAKGLSPETVADPLRFTRFLGNAAKVIRVDNDLTDSELRSTAVSLRLKPSEIKLISIPVRPGRQDQKPVYNVDKDQLKDLSHALRKDTMPDYMEKYEQG